MNKEFIAGILGWLLPGVGHAYKGETKRALIFGGTVWLLFIVAIWGGGAYYPGLQWDDGPLLYLLNVFARAGNVVGALFSWWIGASPAADVAELAAFGASASVFADNCMLADAYATAFMVMGVEGSKAILDQNPSIDGFLIFSDKEGEIKTYVTDGIAANIEATDV